MYVNLYITPFFITGKVNIDISILSDTDRVVVHSKDLKIDSVKINNEIGTYELEPNYELLTIKKTDNSLLKVGDATVQIEFNGDMKNRIVGLYTSSYKNSEGVNR